jgi:hypothetical protein
MMAVASGCATYNTSGPVTSVASGNGQAVASQTPTAQTAAKKLTALAVTVDKDCTVGQPFLASLLTLQTDPAAIDLVKKAQDKAGEVCTVVAAIAHPVSGATVPTLDLATVKAFADSQVPVLLDLVKKSGMDDKAKTAAGLAITGMQAALLIAVVNAQ